MLEQDLSRQQNFMFYSSNICSLELSPRSLKLVWRCTLSGSYHHSRCLRPHVVTYTISEKKSAVKFFPQTAAPKQDRQVKSRVCRLVWLFIFYTSSVYIQQVTTNY